MMLAIRPELVAGDADRVPDIPFGSGAAPGYRGWTMADRSEPGHIGSAAAATATKGEQLFGVFTGGVADFLERVAGWDGHGWDV